MECDACHSAQHFRRDCLQVMEEAGVRQCIWLRRTPTYSMLTGSRFWPTLPTAQPQLFMSWLPGI
eukprot:7083668-Pyramimonas_sp.AAC.1